MAVEANYDGIVGPTHNYGGLSDGNMASQANEGLISNPRAGALEGLAKMKRLAGYGLVQGVLPPHERPYIPLLKAAGFTGSDAAALAAAWRGEPALVRAASSASAMWAANAATVSPSADTQDGRLHLTPANLHSMLHRSLEGPQTRRALERAFPNRDAVRVHAPLPAHAAFADEGAANHVRLAAEPGAPGVELFVHGRDRDERADLSVPARQSRQACEAIARSHGLKAHRTVFGRQSTAAMEAGAFHNDVVSVGTATTLFTHEDAFGDAGALFEALRRAADGLFDPQFVVVPRHAVSLADAVRSYLFNSQLLAVPGHDRLVLLAPIEAQEHGATRAYCDGLMAGDGPIGTVEYVDVRQSMRNGGGPACLRLRVALNDEERAGANPAMLWSDTLEDQLAAWVRAHYRDRLAPNDLGDPALLEESRTALDELTGILGLGGDFYDFQRETTRVSH